MGNDETIPDAKSTSLADLSGNQPTHMTAERQATATAAANEARKRRYEAEWRKHRAKDIISTLQSDIFIDQAIYELLLKLQHEKESLEHGDWDNADKNAELRAELQERTKVTVDLAQKYAPLLIDYLNNLTSTECELNGGLFEKHLRELSTQEEKNKRLKNKLKKLKKRALV